MHGSTCPNYVGERYPIHEVRRGLHGIAASGRSETERHTARPSRRKTTQERSHAERRACGPQSIQFITIRSHLYIAEYYRPGKLARRRGFHFKRQLCEHTVI